MYRYKSLSKCGIHFVYILYTFCIHQLYTYILYNFCIQNVYTVSMWIVTRLLWSAVILTISEKTNANDPILRKFHDR